MRVLVIGAGTTGAKVILQLRKNPDIEIVTADPREETYAVDEEIIDKVDIREVITPLNLEHIVEQIRPDLIFLAMSTEDMDLGKAPGVDILADSLREELAAIADIPLIEIARAGT